MNKKVSKKDLREFGLIVGTLFPILIGWAIPLLFQHSFRFWTLYISIPLVSLAVFAPNKLSYIYKKWFEIGNFLANINSFLIFGIIFFVIIFPMSLIMKLVKYDPLKLGKVKKLTYKEFRKYNKFDLENIF